ncbi:hypothetical protein HN014_10715 [Aquimarina sp. TRL1]|uniref:hypothetical protein n=1 Tax=Aquimarina sp. (strain TRL1) TaxID=2736252 RepID=UPI00158834FA|nr:hypothetical protein [Aquimarina sp. TRL1]QKX05366.1 hypothetical protein HN014_10715 [Aquimarina sp. TRL1]
MIAGETEYLLEDDFFRSKAQREKRRAARKARRLKRRRIRNAERQRRRDIKATKMEGRQKRRTFLSKLGAVYRDLGGAGSIGKSIDTMLNNPIDKKSSVQNQEDFTVALESSKKNNKPSYTPWIIGGSVVLGVVVIGAVIYSQNQKNYLGVIKQ